MPDAANWRRMIGLLGLDMWSPATKLVVEYDEDVQT